MTDPAHHSVRQHEVVNYLLDPHCPLLPPGSIKGGGARFAESGTWVALDDDDSLVTDGRYKELATPHTVLTQAHRGLTDAHADAAIGVLNGGCPSLAEESGGGGGGGKAKGKAGGGGRGRGRGGGGRGGGSKKRKAR